MWWTCDDAACLVMATAAAMQAWAYGTVKPKSVFEPLPHSCCFLPPLLLACREVEVLEYVEEGEEGVTV